MPRYIVSPADKRRKNLLGARRAITMPRDRKMPRRVSKPKVPASPVSSANEVKIKSEWATGTKAGDPIPIPRPHKPPFAIAIND